MPRLFFLTGLTMMVFTALVYDTKTIGVPSTALMLTSGYLRLMFGKMDKGNPQIRQYLGSIRLYIEHNFGGYSDVKQYLSNFDAELSHIDEIKATTQQRIKIFKNVLYAIMICSLIVYFIVYETQKHSI